MGCENVKMRRWENVQMRERETRCVKMCQDVSWEDVKVWGCPDVKSWSCEDAQMWECEDVKMRRSEEDEMWRREDGKMCKWDVRMRWCEDMKMYSSQTSSIWRTPLSDAVGENENMEKDMENRVRQRNEKVKEREHMKETPETRVDTLLAKKWRVGFL